MANRLPQQVREKIICIVYRKADEFAYMECDRVKNGQFMDILVEDPDVGGVLYAKRTYTHLYQGHDP